MSDLQLTYYQLAITVVVLLCGALLCLVVGMVALACYEEWLDVIARRRTKERKQKQRQLRGFE